MNNYDPNDPIDVMAHHIEQHEALNSIDAPHDCDTADCPGSRNKAKLAAGEALASAVRYQTTLMKGTTRMSLEGAVATYDKAAYEAAS